MLQGRQRYVQHLQGLLKGHLPSPHVIEGKITLGYASPLPALLLNDKMPAFAVPSPSVIVADSFGHQRPPYRGLLAHAWARAICRGWNPPDLGAIEAWYADLARRVDLSQFAGQSFPAARGFELCQNVWYALAVYTGGIAFEKPAWTQLGHQVFERLLAAAQPRGTFMAVGVDDNLESWWYHELVILHAATTYSAPRRDARWQSLLKKAAEYHFAETQPDHASTQPWAVHTFLLHPATVFLADQMIHATVTQGGGHPEAVPAILFADALDCLDRIGGA